MTVSLVEEARGGPFVYWDGLENACQEASRLGFHGIEIFAPGPEAVDQVMLKDLLRTHSLQLAAVGTGAGMVKHGLSLTDRDSDRRTAALAFIERMIDFGAQFSAPAIIGSMQGKWTAEVPRPQALSFLQSALNRLGAYAAARGVRLLYEPLNRYETNLIKTLADGAALLSQLETNNVQLLADLFHMNIEETNIEGAIRSHCSVIGHVHFVDSNREAAGRGHLDLAEIALALRESGYKGFVSAEALAIPDSHSAAATTIATYRTCFGP